METFQRLPPATVHLFLSSLGKLHSPWQVSAILESCESRLSVSFILGSERLSLSLCTVFEAESTPMGDGSMNQIGSISNWHQIRHSQDTVMDSAAQVTLHLFLRRWLGFFLMDKEPWH